MLVHANNPHGFAHQRRVNEDNIDLNRNLPLLGINDGKIVGCATLHQQTGGWKRHIGRVSVLVHPDCRSKGLARALVSELIQLARFSGLEHVEAEFAGECPERLDDAIDVPAEDRQADRQVDWSRLDWWEFR